MPEKRRKSTRLWRVILPLVTLGWVLFLFGQSGLPGDVSGRQSQQLAAWVSGADEVLPDPALETALRKGGHFAGYMLLGLLLALTLRAFTRRVVVYAGWPLLLGLLIASLDEAYQLFVPGRSGMVADVVLDFAGLLAGMALVYAALGAAAALRAVKTPPGPGG